MLIYRGGSAGETLRCCSRPQQFCALLLLPAPPNSRRAHWWVIDELMIVNGQQCVSTENKIKACSLMWVMCTADWETVIKWWLWSVKKTREIVDEAFNNRTILIWTSCGYVLVLTLFIIVEQEKCMTWFVLPSSVLFQGYTVWIWIC